MGEIMDWRQHMTLWRSTWHPSKHAVWFMASHVAEKEHMTLAMHGRNADQTFQWKIGRKTYVKCVWIPLQECRVLHFLLICHRILHLSKGMQAWLGITCSFSVRCNVINQSPCLARCHELLHTIMCCCQSMISVTKERCLSKANLCVRSWIACI